ncbi:MAG: iron complex outermembrane receptor protein [Limisphaerales bacterium]|jgi:iron complex outermembrane receptor protein
MNSKPKLKTLYLAVLMTVPAAGSLTVANNAYAQLEEIVVTARARSETLQDVPATITAFTENQIENMGIQRAEDFVYMTPGVTFVNTVEAGDSSLSIRGISGARDGETNFAFLVDGILYTNPSAFNREYPDLTQIEVLKGPQGALYGRSAAGGAVIMSTRKPSDEFEGKVKVSAAQHGTYTAMGTIAGPLGENIAGRLTVDHRTTDGFLENEFYNDEVVNDFEETGVSLRLVFDPSDTLSIDTKLRYSEVEAGAIAFNAAFELPFFVGALEGVSGFGVDNTAASVDVNDFDFVFSPNVDPENKQETIEFSIKVDKELDIGTLTAWALYSDQEQSFIADGTSGAFGFYDGTTSCQESAVARSLFLGDGTPTAAPTFNLDGTADGRFLPPYSPTTCDGYQYQERNQEDFSAQIQLTSSGDGALRWQVGAYYLNIERTVGVAQLEDDGRRNLPSSFVNEFTDALVLDDFTTDVFAVFGSINYDISDRMELSVAIRYDREDREVENKVPSPADGFLSTNIDYCSTFFVGGCTLNGVPLEGTPWNPAFIDLDTGEVRASVADRDETFDAVQPKISLTYDVGEDTTLFASWGVGFKTGGFNNLGGTETIELFLVNPDGLPIAPPEVYEEETSSAFEVGFSSTMLDGSLQLNGAVFYTEVDDMQFFEFYVGPFGLLRTVEAIDEVTIKGFELGASWQLNTSLRLDAGYSQIDGEIDKMTVRPYVSGNDVPNLAEYTANIALTWDQKLSGGLNILARLEYAYQGDIFYHVVQGGDLDVPRPGDFEGLPNEVPAVLFGGLGTSYSKTKVDGYGIMNARLGVGGDNWRVTAFARNLLDEEYVGEVILAPEFGGGFVTPGNERTAGVELEYRF